MNMKQKLKRKCKKCNFGLFDIDPHMTCKACRQPDPQEFYCSVVCEGCEVIKNCKPLYFMLHKQELERLEKKLDTKLQTQFPNKSKNDYCWSTNSLSNESEKLKEHSSNSENVDSISSTIFEKVMIDMLNTSGNSSGNAGTGALLSCFTKALNSYITNENQKETPSLDKEKCNYESNTLKNNDISKFFALFSHINPNSVVRFNNKSNEGEKDHLSFKISSKACDILFNSTILSSPSQAEELSKKLKVKLHSIAWPANLDYLDFMKISENYIPHIKLHPKIRNMQNIIFGKLNLSLPQNILSDVSYIPELSAQQKSTFLFAREQLKYLLLIYSMIDYFHSGNYDNNILHNFFDMLLFYSKMCLENQANSIGLVIHDIRKNLLSFVDSERNEDKVRLIRGPIHQSQFFGTYVKELQELVDKNSAYHQLKFKHCKISLKVTKLPNLFKEGDNYLTFLMKLKSFYIYNKTNESDKLLVLITLLPQQILERLCANIKPHKLADKAFEYILCCLERLILYKDDQIIKRQTFSQTQQIKEQSILDFTSELENNVIGCNYGIVEREMLRDRFIFGLYDKNIQKELLKKTDFTFEDCYVYALSKEELVQQTKISPIKDKKNSPILVSHKLIQSKVGCSSKPKNFKAITKDKNSSDKNSPTNKDNNHSNNFKRKLYDGDDNSSQSKKTKVNNIKFYECLEGGISTSQKKIINMKTTNDWNKVFGYDAALKFTVYCPWTGKVLRTN